MGIFISKDTFPIIFSHEDRLIWAKLCKMLYLVVLKNHPGKFQTRMIYFQNLTRSLLSMGTSLVKF